MKIYKFGADWCGPCRVLNQRLDKFNGCEVVKYDVDEMDENILDKYHIKNIPVTILVDDNENEVYKWVGLFDVNEITEKLKEHD